MALKLALGSGQASLLYGRAYALTIAPPSSMAANMFGNVDDNQSALRITFEVEKTATLEPNKAKLTLYNLNQEERTSLTVGSNVALDAGYVGLCERLFRGVVHKIKSERRGAEIETTLECLDGAEALTVKTLDKNYPEKTKLTDVLKDLAEAMGVKPGIVLGIPNMPYPRKLAVSGACVDSLEQILDPLGLEASVQNGKLNIVPLTAHLGVAAVVLSPETGLINVPSVNGDAIELEALCNPKLVPTQLIKVLSADTASCGFFKIRTCRFKGDTFGQAWDVRLVCSRVRQPVQELIPAAGFNYLPATLF